MQASRFRQALTYIGAAWAVLGLAFAVILLVDIQSRHEDRPGDVFVASAAAVAIMLGTGLALVGLLRIGQDPATGRQMTLIGAVVAGGTAMFLMSWMWFVGIVLALPLVIIAIVRARQVTQAGPRQPV